MRGNQAHGWISTPTLSWLSMPNCGLFMVLIYVRPQELDDVCVARATDTTIAGANMGFSHGKGLCSYPHWISFLCGEV